MSILDAKVVVGLFIGAMLPYLFSAFTMSSVGKAANKMIDEVRRQFREKPGILKGTEKPDYKKCVSISTNAALHEMVLPGIMAIIIPLIVGYLLGVESLGGLLAGSLVSGVMMAIFMANSGGAWDNAKKYIEGLKGHIRPVNQHSHQTYDDCFPRFRIIIYDGKRRSGYYRILKETQQKAGTILPFTFIRTPSARQAPITS